MENKNFSIGAVEIQATVCETLKYQLDMIHTKFNPVGMTASLSVIPMPCTVPKLPISPNLIQHVYNALPECMMKIIDECGGIDGWEIKSLYNLDDTLKGFEGQEEAEKYWSSLDIPIPNIILYVEDESGRKAFILVLLTLSSIMPGMHPLIKGFLVIRGDVFNELLGVSGRNPNLLAHYDRYDIKDGVPTLSSKQWFEEA